MNTTQKQEPWIKRLLSKVRSVFTKHEDKIEPPRPARPNSKQPKISIVDCLMSGLAVFALKCASLLQFDRQKKEEATEHNLRTLYGIAKAPCDTYLRERLDTVDPATIRPAFTGIFSLLQRNKVLENYQYLDEGYCISVDGSGHFASGEISCPNCCAKHCKHGVVYYHQVFQGALVHPENNIPIPLCPEPILKEIDQEKNDCELNAAKRFFQDLRREHPHLKIVILSDAIGANGPYIKSILSHSMSYIIGATPTGNTSLFQFIKGIALDKLECMDEAKGIRRTCEFINNIPLNHSHNDLNVNLLIYRETELVTGITKTWSWITNIEIKPSNAFKIMRAGRARWKIENETFNTLKNQGYNLEHNFGHGNKHLCTVFAMLTLLAFLIDQAQQLLCSYFGAALAKCKSKIGLWHHMRAFFTTHFICSWEDLFLSISHKPRKTLLVPDTS